MKAIFFEQSPIAPEELDDFKIVVERLRRKKLHELSQSDRDKLLELALQIYTGNSQNGHCCPRYWKTSSWKGGRFSGPISPIATRRHSVSTR